MKPLVVLSIFDGISCGLLALKRAGIPVESYYASEIDKYAMFIAKKNHQEITHIGDVNCVSYKDGVLYTANENFEIGSVDLVLAGFPCQSHSFSGKMKGFEDPRGKLFFELMRIRDEVKVVNPNVKFLFENVVMKKESQDFISSLVGVSPEQINSSYFSAQNRRRLYWFNWNLTTPIVDRNIFLKDIIESDALPLTLTERRTDEARKIRREMRKTGRDFSPRRAKELVARTDGKSNCLTATLSEKEHLVQIDITGGAFRGRYNEDGTISQHLEINDTGRSNTLTSVDKDNVMCIQVGEADVNGHDQLKRVYSIEGKAPTLTAICGGNQEAKIAVDGTLWRKLTPLEYERLQTLNDGYTDGCSDNQRRKMCGNGWNVETVRHILKDGFK